MEKYAKLAAVVLVTMAIVKFYANSSMPGAAVVAKYL